MMKPFDMSLSSFPPISTSLVLTSGCCCFLAVRLIQRVYFMLKGHPHLPSTYSPRQDFENFLLTQGIIQSSHEIISSKDGVTLKYRRLGTGEKYFLMSNGVGTDFFMWYPLIRNMLKVDPDLFNKITLLVPTYRGLFIPTDEKFYVEEVEINITNFVNDLYDIMKDAKVDVLDGHIGWSTGALVGLNFAAISPNLVKSLFLLNPSIGKTMHTIFQPFVPLPSVCGKLLSSILCPAIVFLKALVRTSVWNYLKAFNDSYVFHLFLIGLSFFGGFPCDQPVYFHEYMKDFFRNRTQSRALLDLFICLDEPSHDGIYSLSQNMVIVSGAGDNLTGEYHATKLSNIYGPSKCRHVSFSMGSHFVLIEWPELLANELLTYLLSTSHYSQ